MLSDTTNGASGRRMFTDTTGGVTGTPTTSGRGVLSDTTNGSTGASGQCVFTNTTGGASGAPSAVNSCSSHDYNLNMDSDGSELPVVDLTASEKNDSVVIRSGDRLCGHSYE